MLRIIGSILVTVVIVPLTPLIVLLCMAVRVPRRKPRMGRQIFCRGKDPDRASEDRDSRETV